MVSVKSSLLILKILVKTKKINTSFSEFEYTHYHIYYIFLDQTSKGMACQYLLE